VKKLLQTLTDKIATRRGMWITLAAWFVVALLLGGLAPGAKDFEKNATGSGLPASAESVIASERVNTYFSKDEGVPALLVVSTEGEALDMGKAAEIAKAIDEASVDHVVQVVRFDRLPPHAQRQFVSEDETTAIIPILLEPGMETKIIQAALDWMEELAQSRADGLFVRFTGPAGIAADATALFSRADVTLILATVGLILVLLIVIYRSPLLALIPLVAAAFVYEVVDKTLGLLGSAAGLEMNAQSLSIMSILLYASVTDYALFVFARYREELKRHESKYSAMKHAMRGTGEPVFFSGGTVLAAMLVLFFANYQDYRDFAPVFSITMLIIMMSSVTLLPALFQLFGRKAFWPKVPKLGEASSDTAGIWGRIGKMVSEKPKVVASVLTVVLVVLSLGVFNMKYQFNTLASFPDDMPSREGFTRLEQHFPKGELSPTTVLVESDNALPEAGVDALVSLLERQRGVESVRKQETSEDGKAAKLSLTFVNSPYELQTLIDLDAIRGGSDGLLEQAGLGGKLHFAGETAKQADIRKVNDRDTWTIVALETLLITLLLWALVRSFKSSLYMMATILLSFAAALGLGAFLADVLFGYDALSSRIPVYSFVFLVALGIDYNIMLMSRFREERLRHPLREAVQIAVSRTGNVITSAGLILAATFAVLMTQPIAELFVFGFIVAIGILLDTLIVRGMLLPALIMLFEKKDAALESTKR